MQRARDRYDEELGHMKQQYEAKIEKVVQALTDSATASAQRIIEREEQTQGGARRAGEKGGGASRGATTKGARKGSTRGGASKGGGVEDGNSGRDTDKPG